jgi:hypothetical protein
MRAQLQVASVKLTFPPELLPLCGIERLPLLQALSKAISEAKTHTFCLGMRLSFSNLFPFCVDMWLSIS